LIVVLFALAADVVFVLFAGALFALFIRTPSVWLSAKTGIRYGTIAAITLLLLTGACGLCVWRIGPQVAEQVHLLSARMPGAAHALAYRLEHLPGWLRELVGQPSAKDIRPEASSVVSSATDIVSGVSVLLGAFVVVFFVGVYGSLDPASYTRVVLLLVPPHHRNRGRELLGHLADTLGRWVIGRVVAMLFVGVFTAIGLELLHIPLALGLGIVAGLLTFVEYLGAVVSAVPAGLLALTLGPLSLLWVILLFLVVHIIEGYVLTPLIAKQAVRFPPAYTLGAQLVFAGLFGVLRLTFATPFCVVTTVLVQAFYVERIIK